MGHNNLLTDLNAHPSISGYESNILPVFEVKKRTELLLPKYKIKNLSAAILTAREIIIHSYILLASQTFIAVCLIIATANGKTAIITAN